MIKNFYTFLFSILCLGMTAQITITDADLGSAEYTWTADNEYLLDGYVFLEDGGKLNIEPGTIIKGIGTPSTGDVSSALIIAKGAQIFANGTKEAPIIFTAELDDVNDGSDLTSADKGLWGGLIILGNAVVGVNGGTQNIEGIPSTEGRAEYGGDNNDDNSGVLKYVSIRHGGSKLEANNEINGLTLGGVGSGTSIDYVEVFANLDDGIEWFGGTVSVKHAVVSFCGDDSYDYDQSWDGKGQFWMSLQDDLSNRAGEWDGSEMSDLTPKVSPIISNVTFIGSGSASNNDDGNDALRIRDDGAVHLYNSIMTSFADGAIAIDNDVSADLPNDSYQRFLDGDITFTALTLFNFGDGASIAEVVSTDGGDDGLLVSHLEEGGSTFENPMMAGVSRMNDGGLDLRLNAGSPALTGAVLISDDFFDPVVYKGAFGNDNNWAEGWTALSDNGFFGDLVTPVSSADVIISDTDINAGETLDLTANNTYFLDGYVFVEDGATINIEAGTIIKGLGSPSTGDGSSALIISQGGTINAVGTADAPIIFTAELDDVDNPDDLTSADKGLWGGLILLGKATTGVNGGTQNIEGIPSTEGRATYGGTEDDDNSGTLKYVSIRHGGDKLEANNEINGLTLGGVGSGTSIDYVEVYANLDDGIEWFGGNVSVKHAVVSFCGDDSYDYDQSWDGKGQFWVSLQDDLSNRAGEWDGSEAADLTPKVSPIISNVTFVGAGADSQNDDGNDALRIRDDGAVHLYNSVMTSFADGAIALDNDVSADLPNDSYQRFLDGDITFTNLVLFNYGDGSSIAEVVSTDGGDDALLVTHLEDNGSTFENPMMAGVSRTNDGGLDLRLNAGSPALTGASLIGDDFFDPVVYKGAFGNANNWAEGWTALSDDGYFGDLVTPVSSADVIIQDSDINAGETLDLTANNVYFLDGYVFVEDGATINIEAGTIIKGLGSPSTGDGSSALIISQGGMINAVGTAEAPIIFTAELDDVDDPDDLTSADKGLWGGLILLGKATTGVNGGTQNIEGIPSTEGRATYGGSEDDDNSGTLKYVSIRHGGDKLEANNEINGLTLGGVGSGTSIDYVEVFANLDDGIEWFGGNVSVNHAVVSFCGDDSYDYDQSWDGKGQWWFSLQDDLSNRAGEWDGSEATDLEPKVSPVLSNLTFIGAGSTSNNDDGNDALRIRDDGAAKVYNAIFTEFADGAIALDNDVSDDLPNDSYQRFLDGDITFTSSVFFGFGDGATLAEIVSTDGGDDALLVTHLTDNGSVYADPGIAGISRTNDGGLDPRVNGDGAAFAIGTDVGDDYFTSTSYAGAFPSDNNWAEGWTALSDNGFFGDLVSDVDDVSNFVENQNLKVYPNPARASQVNIELNLEETKRIALNITDMNGRVVKTVSSVQNYVSGKYILSVNVDDLPNGYYTVNVIADQSVRSSKLIISK